MELGLINNSLPRLSPPAQLQCLHSEVGEPGNEAGHVVTIQF